MLMALMAAMAEEERRKRAMGGIRGSGQEAHLSAAADGFDMLGEPKEFDPMPAYTGRSLPAPSGAVPRPEVWGYGPLPMRGVGGSLYREMMREAAGANIGR